MELDEEQDMERRELHRLDGEQVAGDDRGRLRSHELAPGVPLGSWTALRCGDAADARRRDIDADLLQLALDAPVAPGGVLLRHPPDDELGLKRDRLSLVDRVWPVPLPADELAVPASERVGSEQAGETLVQRTEPL